MLSDSNGQAIAGQDITSQAGITVDGQASGDVEVPLVMLSSPAPTAQLGGTVMVSGTATDNTGVTSVECFVDGAALDPITVSGNPAEEFGVAWDTTTSADGTHTVSCVAKDAAGNTNQAVRSVTVRNGQVQAGADSTPPSTPQNLASRTARGAIVLSWDAATDPESSVSGYIVYRDGTQVGRTTTTSFVVRNPGTGAHAYSVSAINGDAMEGAQSSPVQATSDGTTTGAGNGKPRRRHWWQFWLRSH
jgi:hypothetical protein